MNYIKIYNSLIDRAKNRTLEGYKESHHIVPKSIGGSNAYTNLVDLTAREHFLAHWLLVKIHPKEFKLLCAWNSFCRTNAPDRVISHHYERCRILWVKELIKRKTTHPEWWSNYTQSSTGTKWLNKEGKNYRASIDELEKLLNEGWNLGRTKHERRHASEETKKKISESQKLRTPPPRKRGNERSDAEKEASRRNAIVRKGRKMLPEQVAKSVASRTGKKLPPRSEEFKQKMRMKEIKIVICPHCGKEGQMIIMGRWHFDKCKQNPENVS